MGGTAQQLFDDNGIKVVGAEGDCDGVVEDYLNGKLKSTGSVCEEHAHEGHCGK